METKENKRIGYRKIKACSAKSALNAIEVQMAYKVSRVRAHKPIQIKKTTASHSSFYIITIRIPNKTIRVNLC